LLSKLEEHLNLDEAATVADENGVSDIDSKTICSKDPRESTGHCEHNFKYFGMVLNINSLPSIVRVVKSRRTRWAGNVARMGEEREVHRVLVGKPEGKRPLGRP
jgi:hypothetical protein